MTKFEELKNKLAEITDLKGAIGILSWDQEVMMPPGGIHLRARQLSTLSGLQHEKYVRETSVLLEQFSDDDLEALSPFESANLLEIQREHTRMMKLPTQLVMDIQKAASEAQHVWQKAKTDKNFSLFEPSLSKLTDLKLQEAECYGYETNPYDAHLDTFEPGIRAAVLEKLFTHMRAELGQLLTSIRNAPQVDDSFLMQEIPIQEQLAFSEVVAAKIGYDFNFGRQDISSHPFSIGFGNQDVRITTRVKKNDITEMLFSTIHESGHAMYEQGVLSENYGLPSGEYCSIGVHESQSRIWENNVGRSLEFWEYFFPAFSQLFPDKLKGKNAIDVFRAVNRVAPSFIRTAADELSYHFHVMLRFEIENLLMNKKVKVSELPELWNAKVKEYLGLTVKDDAEGVLQDVHWSHGSFGYFPTYSLGSFYAAQYMAKAKAELPGLPEAFKKGEFSSFRNWLKVKVHEKGRLDFPEKLCENITGEPLNVKYFIDYAKEKFSLVYQVNI